MPCVEKTSAVCDLVLVTKPFFWIFLKFDVGVHTNSCQVMCKLSQ
jgi:hypothetical protein